MKQIPEAFTAVFNEAFPNAAIAPTDAAVTNLYEKMLSKYERIVYTPFNIL